MDARDAAGGVCGGGPHDGAAAVLRPGAPPLGPPVQAPTAPMVTNGSQQLLMAADGVLRALDRWWLHLFWGEDGLQEPLRSHAGISIASLRYAATLPGWRPLTVV